MMSCLTATGKNKVFSGGWDITFYHCYMCAMVSYFNYIIDFWPTGINLRSNSTVFGSIKR